MPPDTMKAGARGGFLRVLRAGVLLAAIPLALAAGAPGPSSHGPTLKLALVDNAPEPGRRGRGPLEGAVSQLRHNYGAYSLVRLTENQEAALREDGYQVRILEDPDRIGVGPYSFTIPAGPSGLPADLLWREKRGE